jgi:hypothetical protein
MIFVFVVSSCKFGGNDLDVTKNYYNPTLLNTGLPIIRIETTGGQAITSKETYINANISITDPNDSGNNLETTTEIRGRGNSSWDYPKKPYRIKFFEKISLFGYQKAKSWVLLANHRDPTLIMNSLAFELGQRFGLPFTNHYVHVELILNGVYEGSYVLTEQVQVGKGRVDIDEDDGFLVEIDSYYDEEPKFKTNNYQLPVMIKSPEDLGNPSGYDFVKNAVNEFAAKVAADSFPENGYRDLIDMDTFVDYIMINEIMCNDEIGYVKSIYMYKDKGTNSKICMGPLWDFDHVLGFMSPHKYFKETDTRRKSYKHPFFNRFFGDSVFRAAYKTRWNEKYTDIASIESFIDQMANTLNKSQKANYAVWQWIDGVNYDQEISKMKVWLRNRISYLNTEINNM